MHDNNNNRVQSQGGMGSPTLVIGKGLFKKQTDMSLFINMRLVTEDGEVSRWVVDMHLHDGSRCGCVVVWLCGCVAVRLAPQEGVIESAFGKSGKFKVTFRSGPTLKPGSPLFLRYKVFIHDEKRGMNQ